MLSWWVKRDRIILSPPQLRIVSFHPLSSFTFWASECYREFRTNYQHSFERLSSASPSLMATQLRIETMTESSLASSDAMHILLLFVSSWMKFMSHKDSTILRLTIEVTVERLRSSRVICSLCWPAASTINLIYRPFLHIVLRALHSSPTNCRLLFVFNPSPCHDSVCFPSRCLRIWCKAFQHCYE